MIRCVFPNTSDTFAELRRRIALAKPNWLSAAAAARGALVAAGRWTDPGSPDWSDVKPVFLELQRNKCAFCERRLEDDEKAVIEFDVEHYRPKKAVLAWKSRDGIADVGGGLDKGYYWLAFDLENYCAACKICNTTQKKNYFPVAAKRGVASADAATLDAVEKPLLYYPVGEREPLEPDALIGFSGPLARPVLGDDAVANRGRAIIDLFELNLRNGLVRERAADIVDLANALTLNETMPNVDYRRDVGRKLAPSHRHAACARAFAALWERRRDDASQIVAKCRAFLESVDQPVAGLPDAAAAPARSKRRPRRPAKRST